MNGKKIRIIGILMTFVLPFYFTSIARTSSTIDHYYNLNGLEIEISAPYEAKVGENVSVTITLETDVLLDIEKVEVKIVQGSFEWIKVLVENTNVTNGWTITEVVAVEITSAWTEMGCRIFAVFRHTGYVTPYIEWVDFNLCRVREVTYDELQADHQSLEISYNSLESSYESLQTEYNALNSTHNSLVSDYEALNSTYNSLETSYSSLSSSYDSLQTSHNSLQTSYDSLKAELTNIRNLMYIFIITTIIFIATTAYLAMRKTKMKPESKTT